MKILFPERVAAYGILLITGLSVGFHVLVLARVVPSEIVWGGGQKDPQQLLVLESVSITINLLIWMVVAVRVGLLKLKINATVIRGALWLMVGVFALNTVGNLFSTNSFEKAAFTPVTLLLALFSLRLVLGNRQQPAATPHPSA
ncbi:hypothetical protein [Solirubrum puertoriconensis]|uniref:Uncharacterized protein n=1 Tax=Solirubrum puertoriconensis TaxID=1751427 RepID=A0A9X0HJX5_SOLP1|nr:hypothetical protein [Solirubrum puertoriconensis]KUG07248.1 hypothetical protein ASU33_12815 [Solirubrum puertoriconensis]